MYKLSVPVMCRTINEENRERYREKMEKAGVRRVFVAVSNAVVPVAQNIIENVAYFKSCGFEVGIWTNSFGHGGTLSHDVGKASAPEFSQIESLDGRKQGHAFCPLDEKFRAHLARCVAALAEATDADVIMLDDDFRMSMRSGAIPSCACPAHMARICEVLGEEITREELYPHVMSGKANKYRDAWLKVQSDGLLEFAKEIRKEVDKKSPNTNVCVCTPPSWWNIDNTDAFGVAQALAGKNPPVLRLTGAPYWAAKQKNSLISVLEISRLHAAFCENSGIEIMSEGDVYPRPRQNCPASFLEIFDGVNRADGGYDGILKYMFDYTANDEMETGYLKLHGSDLPLFEKIHEWFKDGANAGVKIFARPHTMKDADLDLSTFDAWSPIPFDGTMLGSCSIPTLHRGEGICNSVFGENARSYDISELKKGTMLDGVSAVILYEKGVDVGIETKGGFEAKNITYLATNEKQRACVEKGGARVLSCKLKEEATPLLYAFEGGEKYPVAYSYENRNGERFIVFLFEGESLRAEQTRCASGVLKSYPTAEVLVKNIPWLARAPLPAYSEKNPELYLMCKKEEDSLAIAAFNCFVDPVTEPIITLDGEYSKIECFGCRARLEGNKIIIEDRLHGYSAALFKVYK